MDHRYKIPNSAHGSVTQLDKEAQDVGSEQLQRVEKIGSASQRSASEEKTRSMTSARDYDMVGNTRQVKFGQVGRARQVYDPERIGRYPHGSKGAFACY